MDLVDKPIAGKNKTNTEKTLDTEKQAQCGKNRLNTE